MAPLPWKASWRRGKNIIIPSDYSRGVDVGSEHGNSQGEHDAKFNPSSGDVVSSTELTASTTRRASSLASDDVHTSTPIPSSPPASTPPLSTTYARFLSTIPGDALPSSPRLHIASEPVTTTSSPEPTTRVPTSSSSSSSSSSRLPPAQKAEPLVNLDVVFPSPSNSKDVLLTLAYSNNIPSSTLSRKSSCADIPHPTTTPLSGDTLRPTKCRLDTNEATSKNMPSATRTLGHLPLSTSASSLFAQDYNTKAHNGILLNMPSPQPSLSHDGAPRLSSTSNTTTSMSTSMSQTLTPPQGQTPTSVPPLTDGGKSPNDKPVKTTASLSGSLLLVSTPPGSKTTSVTTSVLSTSVTGPSVLKTKTTDSIVTTDHPAGAVHTLIPSDVPQKNGKSKPEPSRSSSSVSLPPDSTSFPGEVGRIAISTASYLSPSTTSFITSTTTATILSLTSVDGVRSAPFSNPIQFAVIDDVPSTTDFSTPTAFGQDVTASFTTTTAVVTFSPIQISGTPTSIPVTQTVQTVLPTVFPGVPATGNKKSAPVAAIAAPVSVAVILILLIIGFVLHRSRQRANRASSQLPFDFSPPAPAPATEPARLLPLKEAIVVLPPILTMGGWGGVFAPAQDPFADPDSMLPNATHLPNELPPTAVPALVLPPAPPLDPFVDPPALVSTPPDGDGPSRLSKGSTYDESISRASISSSHVGYAM